LSTRSGTFQTGQNNSPLLSIYIAALKRCKKSGKDSAERLSETGVWMKPAASHSFMARRNRGVALVALAPGSKACLDPRGLNSPRSMPSSRIASKPCPYQSRGHLYMVPYCYQLYHYPSAPTDTEHRAPNIVLISIFISCYSFRNCHYSIKSLTFVAIHLVNHYPS
jgi:hypothetical protein